MISPAFLKRLKQTQRLEIANMPAAIDEKLSDAILAALDDEELNNVFFNEAGPTGAAGAGEEWVQVARQVFEACGGNKLALPELATYLCRIQELGFAPMGMAFADALIDAAERDGWSATLANACLVPVEIMSDLVRAWDDGDEAVKKALDAEFQLYNSNNE